MRDLTKQEADDIIRLDGIQWVEIGYTQDGPGRYIEASVQELSDAGIGTACGGSDVFNVLADNGYEHRKVRGFLCEDENVLTGMIYIKIQTEKTALKIESILEANDALLRFDSPADSSTSLKGYMVFEDE